jgi:hypothetical protein
MGRYDRWRRFDQDILKMNSQMFEFGSDIAKCSHVPMNPRTFNQMVANLFVSGISAGYLAAHVLISQLVFVILNFLYSGAMRESE